MNPRIITGSAKGVTLDVHPNSRPITDRAKASLFSMLADDILDKKILDLYAGSGSIGLEALSRGAKSCVFVDNAYDVVEVLKTNINRSKLDNASQVSRVGVSTFLDMQEDEEYDIIFSDPPFRLFSKKKFVPKQLAKMIKLIPQGGGIVMKHPPTTKAEDFENLKHAECRCFGESCFSIWVKMK